MAVRCSLARTSAHSLRLPFLRSGTLELTTSAFGYGSTNSTVENNIKYTQSADYNFAHWTDANATAAGFTAASSNVTGKFADYGRYFGYNAADSSKIVYNEIPYFIKKSSEFTDSVLSAPVVFTATPSVNVNLYKGIGLVLDGKRATTVLALGSAAST